MIELAPLKDKNTIKQYFLKYELEFDEFSGVVTAKNGQEIIGFCIYSLDNEKMTVLYIEPISDIPLADGILRSTLHVAAERSIMNAFYAKTVPENFLEKIDFIKSKNEKSLKIDKLFKSCCNCG